MGLTIIKIILTIISTMVGWIIGYCIADKFSKLSKAEQIEQLKQWLLLAVTEAERIYGEKLGSLKLEYVYEEFRRVFPKLANKISFETFSKYVDIALEKMRKCIASNEKFKDYIEE